MQPPNQNQAAQEQINLPAQPAARLENLALQPLQIQRIENPQPQQLQVIVNQPLQQIEQVNVVQNHFEPPPAEEFEPIENEQQQELERPPEEIQHEEANELQFEVIEQQEAVNAAAHIQELEEGQQVPLNGVPQPQQPQLGLNLIEGQQVVAPNQIQNPPLRRLHDDDDEKEPFQLPQEERHRLDAEAQTILRRNLLLQEQLRPSTPRTIKNGLVENLNEATGEVAVGDRAIRYIKAPEQLYQDPKWKFFHGNLGTHSVGGCHFANGQHSLGAQHIATMLELNIQGRLCPAPLFAILDPQIGFCATQYLVQQLPKTLLKHLNAQNANGLSQAGIYNSLSLAFSNLQNDFITKYSNSILNNQSREAVADHGSSATVVLVLNGAVWTAQLGSSRAACNSEGNPIQLTSNPDPSKLKYKNLVEGLGGEVDENGLVNGRTKMATSFGRNDLRGAISSKPIITTYAMNMLRNPQLIIGTDGLFKFTSTQRIIGMMHQNRNLESRDLAHDLVYSVHQNNQQSPNALVRNRPLSCLVVKFNSVPQMQDIGDGWEAV